MKGRRPLIVIALGAVLSAGILGYVFELVLPAWNTSHTVVEGVPHTRSTRPPCEGRARRVFVMVVDGLGYEHAKAQDALAGLREAGAFRPLVVDFPTFTAPAVTTMFVGLGPLESGVRLNGAATGATGLDDVLSSATSSGVRVEVHARTYPPFRELVRPPPLAVVDEGEQAFLDAGEARHCRPQPTWAGGVATEIVVVHVGEADDVGHEFGAASAEFAKAADEAASLVTRASGWMDPTQDVLFVLSDHGHRAARGHGGDEDAVTRAFFLAWGRGVRRGVVLEERPMRDVASTFTATLGVATPSSNLGRPMFDVFESGASRGLGEPFAAAAHYTCSLTESDGCASVEAVAARLDAGEDPAGASALLDELHAAHLRRVRAECSERRSQRLGVGVALATLACGLAWRVARPRARLGGLSALVSATPYVGLLAARGYRPTLSTMPPAEVFLPHSLEGALLSALAVSAFAWRFAWRDREATFLILVTAAPILVLAAYVGHDPRAIAPPVASALLFLLGPLIVAASLSACAIVIVARLRAPR